VQVMNEGPGHIPMHMIRENMEKQLEWCDEAPFYTLGPLTTTSRPATSHHSGSARHDCWYGCAMLCYSRRKNISVCRTRNVKDGVIAYKIAAHAADLAKGHPGAQYRDTPSRRHVRIPLGRPVQSLSRPADRAAFHDETLPMEAPRPHISFRCAVRIFAACVSPRCLGVTQRNKA